MVSSRSRAARRPTTAAALVAVVAAESAAMIGLGLWILAHAAGGGLITGSALIVVGLLVGLNAAFLAQGRMGAHRLTVFIQTFVLVSGFSALSLSLGWGLGLIGAGAAALVTGFAPGTRIWFEAEDTGRGSS